MSVSIINEIWSKRSVALSVLFVGGTGQISLTSVCEAVAAGHKVTVFNRGKSSVAELPAGVTTIVGDIHDQETYAKLGASKFDVVCAFMVFKPEHIRQDIATFSGKVGHYVFISSASCYLKPVRHYIITEKTPLENPYWEYSRNKIACERLLQDQSKLPYTIVWTALFDNSKIKSAVGEFTCSEDLDKILAEPVAVAKRNLELRGAIGATNMIDREEQDEDTLMDHIIADQSALGSH